MWQYLALVGVISAAFGLNIYSASQGNEWALNNGYMVFAWGGMLIMAISAFAIPEFLGGKFSFSAAGMVIQGFSMLTMIAGVSVSLSVIINGSDLSIANIPLGKLITPFTKSMISVGIGIFLAAAVNFIGAIVSGEDETGKGGSSYSKMAGALGIDPYKAQQLEEDITRLTQQVKEFTNALTEIGKLLQALDKFFEGKGGGGAP